MAVDAKLLRILLIVGLLTFGGSALAQDEGGSVPMFRGNSAHTGEMPGPGPDPALGIVERWRFVTEGGVSSSPAVADGVVYVRSNDRNLFALDAINGSERWRFATGSSTGTSPAVVDGVVYVGSDDRNLYALDAESGVERWRFAVGFPRGHKVWSSPTVADGMVYVGSSDDNVYALDAVSGSERWRFATGSWVESSPAVVDGVVYVGSRDGNVYALDAVSGSERWRFATDGGVSSSPAVVDGVVYVGSDDHNVYALDAQSGSEQWRFATGGIYVGDTSPAVADGVVYYIAMGEYAGNLYALDVASGTERWRIETENESATPVLADEVVYLGSYYSLLALDARSGEERWRFETDNDVSSSPAVVDGVVYVGSDDGNVYAIGNPTEEMVATQAAIQTEVAATQVAVETAEAIYRATVEAQQATEQTWADYFSTMVARLRGSDNLPAGFSIGDWLGLSQSDVLPAGWSQGVQFPVDLLGDGDSSGIVLTIYESKESADAAYDGITSGLLRAGWQSQDVDGIDHNHTCLSLVRDGGSTAICYVTRDEAIITTYSFLPFEARDAVLLNAVDLAIFANSVYDEVERPF